MVPTPMRYVGCGCVVKAHISQWITINLEIFIVKYFRSQWRLRKLKLACTISANAVRGRSYENFFTQKFIIRKFIYTKISRSTVYHSVSDIQFQASSLYCVN